MISPKVASRPGGYTRVIKLGKRAGDNAELGMIELVDYNEIYGNGVTGKEEAAAKKTRRAGSRKKATAVKEKAPVEEATTTEAIAAEEVPPIATPDAPEAQDEPVK